MPEKMFDKEINIEIYTEGGKQHLWIGDESSSGWTSDIPAGTYEDKLKIIIKDIADFLIAADTVVG